MDKQNKVGIMEVAQIILEFNLTIQAEDNEFIFAKNTKIKSFNMYLYYDKTISTYCIRDYKFNPFASENSKRERQCN